MEAFKRIFAIILVTVILLSAIPFTANAYTTGQYVTTAVLNVRSSPSTSAGRIGQLSNGSLVTVIAVSGNWGQILYGDQYGWISLDYVQHYMPKQYTLSADGLAMIKSLEGFYPYAYFDYTQWSIGYGTACGQYEYPNGITEAQASALLVSKLGTYENYLDNFLGKYTIYVTQNQYDALVSFTYNLGDVWNRYDTFKLKNILINGASNYSSQEILDAFNEFVRAGGAVVPGLVSRRATEAAMFISGTNYDIPFVDVAYNAWYHDAIKFCYENGIMNGISSSRFDPSGNLTRGMVVTILGKLDGINISEYAYTSFADVMIDRYYAPYVQWAYQSGITNGIGEGFFSPETPVTRQDMLCMVYRYTQYKGKSVKVSSNAAYMNFNDYNHVSDYAVTAVNWAVDRSVVVGNEFGYLKPTDTIIRAESAQIMYTYSKNILKK